MGVGEDGDGDAGEVAGLVLLCHSTPMVRTTSPLLQARTTRRPLSLPGLRSQHWTAEALRHVARRIRSPERRRKAGMMSLHPLLRRLRSELLVALVSPLSKDLVETQLELTALKGDQ